MRWEKADPIFKRNLFFNVLRKYLPKAQSSKEESKSHPPPPKKKRVNDAEEVILRSTIAETVLFTFFKQNYGKQKVKEVTVLIMKKNKIPFNNLRLARVNSTQQNPN